ncbi:glycoside hydrolase family 2 protein [Vibrio vulnificus]|uniref:glycoside hydrolase family 2 TIM barrel-domain containing protein n=1 Tax=Vibrio vulnificus TaxID=672 RepID=UPI00102A78B8|nr:glycoside hydrolase family 2 TIM barrel-domain containing protein [Vibrio vulnificus]EGR0753354.1 glycoside hydrolase family 2 protein [Vibrio vulnificus]RZP86469.1 glycoside hydrolase family 2 protein [Vibrio vulnificus]HAS8441708.1 glycoside hydrolase family 2 protein [Vibrio vulnificus]
MNPSPRHICLFNDNWSFQLNENEPDHNCWNPIILPHDWSIQQPFSSELDGATGYLPGGVGWYKKAFVSPLSQKFTRCVILFDGIYNNAEVYLNGKCLHQQHYGYSPFYLDITEHLKEDNELIIKVDRRRYVDSRWYTGSGIYRDVAMILTGDTHSPLWSNVLKANLNNNSLTAGSIEQSLTVCSPDSNHHQQGRLVTQVIDLQTLKVAAENRVDFTPSSSTQVTLNIEIANPALWSPDTPNLYRVVSKIYLDNVWVDVLKEHIGFRTLEFSTSQGFFLSGQPTKIKGVCLHHDGGLVGAAVPDEIWIRRLNKLKECGVNAIRIAHNPASKRFLTLCDELGFLVQDEFFDEWDYPKDKRLNMNDQHDDFISRGYTEYFEQHAKQDLTNTLRSHINHPCIFMWSIGNEIEWTYPRNVEATGFFDASWDGNYFWSLPPNSPDEIKDKLNNLPHHTYDIGKTANKLASWVKAIDQTRPITANCILPSSSYHSGYADALDVIGFSYRRVVYDYGHEIRPNLPIIGNENLPQWHEWKAVLERNHVSGLFLWTGINYIGESHGKWPVRTTDSGLLDTAGFEKPSFALFKSLWTDEPYVKVFTQRADLTQLKFDEQTFVAFERDENAWQKKLWVWDERNSHWNYENEQWVTIEAYSNCPQVQLYLNDELVGTQQLEKQIDRVFRWALPYKAGKISLVGLKNDVEVTRDEIVTSGVPRKISIVDETHEDSSTYRQLIVQMLDKDNHPVSHEEALLEFRVRGCEWIGADNGSISSINAYNSPTIATRHGRVLAVVKSSQGQNGDIEIYSKSGVKASFSLL